MIDLKLLQQQRQALKQIRFEDVVDGAKTDGLLARCRVIERCDHHNAVRFVGRHLLQFRQAGQAIHSRQHQIEQHEV